MLNKRHFLPKLILIAIVFSLVLSLVLAIPGYATDVGDYDYSRPASPYNTTLGGSDILNRYLGTDIEAVERAYLDMHSTVVLQYDGTITTSRIYHEYGNGTLIVNAKEYSYLAQNGITVRWIPATATLGTETSDLSPVPDTEDMYSTAFDGVTEDAGLVLSVEYRISFVIAKDDMARLLRQAYTDAQYWNDEIPRRVAEYERLVDEYEAKVLDHDQYLDALSKYETDYPIYLDYLEAKYIYDEKLKIYNDYLADLDAYYAAIENNKNLDKLWEQYYIDYAIYRDYLVTVEQYEAKYAEYEIDYAEYLKVTERLQNQLSAIEAAAIPMTLDRTVYSAVMGSMVTQVLENKTLITGSLIGVAEEVVNDAGRATDNLRVLLPYYFHTLTTFEDRYAYYTVNYEAFRDNFSLLLRSLDCLYRNNKVRGMLISKGLNEKYVILVAQLAHIANALSDAPIRSYYGEYTYGDEFRIDGKTVMEVLEYKSYLTDTGAATPDPNGYPTPITPPTEPEFMAEPTKPAKVEVPAYPPEVPDPGDAPPVVDEPIMPELVEHPGEPPIPYTAPAEIDALVSAYKVGELDYILSRTMPDEDYAIPITKTVSRRPFDPNEVTVSFFDARGVLLESVSVDRGTIADYTGDIPTKPADAQFTYEFDGWLYEDMTTDADLSAVEENVKVYPKFKPTLRTYNITFKVGNTETVLNYPYGSTPEYTKIPTVPNDEYYYYKFSGWDKEIEAVRGEETYTADFTKEYILPFVGGGASVTEDEHYFHASASDASTPRFDIANLLALAKASIGRDIRLTTRFADITISYATAVEMYNNGDTVLSLPITQVHSYGYRYSVVVTDKDGNRQNETYRIDVSVSRGALSEDGVLFHIADGERRYVKHSANGAIISFTALTDVDYEYVIERRVSTISSSLVSISATKDIAHPGEPVWLTYKVGDGAKLDRIYVVDADGNEIIVEGGRFIMPDSDVIIGAIASLKEYKITFKDGKRIIATQIYKHGDTVVPPNSPSKLSDVIYNYTFLGWGKTRAGGVVDIPQVTEDATYVAIYRAEIIYKDDDGDRIYIEERFMRLIVAGIIAVIMLTIVIIPVIIISVVTVKRVKRMKIQKPKE